MGQDLIGLGLFLSNYEDRLGFALRCGHLLLGLDLALGQDLLLGLNLLLGHLFSLDGLLIFGRETNVGEVNIVHENMIPRQIIGLFSDSS